MARSLIHRLKRLESRFRPGYQRPEIVINCVGAADRRMAEMGYKLHRPLPRFGVPADRPITLVEIMHAARRRAALSRVESNSHESTQQKPSQA